MSLQDKTAYPRIPNNISHEVLNECYTPSEHELEFSLQKTLNSSNQLLFLLVLKLYQNLGYSVKLYECPPQIINHIATIIGVGLPDSEDLFCFDRTSQKDRYLDTVRKYFKIKFCSPNNVFAITYDIAKNKTDIIDVINATIESLISNYYELPKFSLLEKLSHKAINKVNNNYYEQIFGRLKKTKINELRNNILVYGSDGKSTWNKLKIEPPFPTIHNIKKYIFYFKWLQTLKLDRKIFDDIPYVKLEQMFDEGIALDFYKIRRMREIKKIALVAIVIKILTVKATDNLVEMFVRLISSMKNKGKEKLLNYKISRLNLVDNIVDKFGEVLVAYKKPMHPMKKIKIIDAAIKNDYDILMRYYEEYNGGKTNSYVHFMENYYNRSRKTIISIFDLIELDFTSKNQNLLLMLNYIKQLDPKRPKIQIKKDKKFNKKWLSKKWLEICKSIARGSISRARFEIYVLITICESIKSREIFIKDSDKFSDYRASLISWKEYEEKILEYKDIINKPVEPENFCTLLKETLDESCANAEKHLKDRGKATINDKGRLKLKKIIGKDKSPEHLELDKLMNEKIENTSLIDIITYSCKSLNLHKMFTPITGVNYKSNDHLKHLIATLFCYGCNISASDGERSILEVDRKQIGRINSLYITEQSLDKAITQVVNVYNKFQLPMYWGDGKHVSVDGTKWNTYVKNLMAQYHIRYRGYGGIAYYHVSDKYIAIYSNFISCGTYEGRFLLDGIICNNSDIKPEFIHGDNHAQSLVIYGLSYLLGIKVMPRMRHLNDLVFYKSSSKKSYSNIDVLFGEKGINWKIIKDYTKEMYRVAISIKEGKVRPSEILNRISNSGSSNKLYMAFRELGRVSRTAYILNYISDFDLQKIVHSATCKSEEFNEYVNWVAFSDKTIKQNNRLEQRKFIKYNHLVTNMVLLYNVKVMSGSINKLTEEGYVVKGEVLKSFSPYRKSHISRFGKFELDMMITGNPTSQWDFELAELEAIKQT